MPHVKRHATDEFPKKVIRAIHKIAQERIIKNIRKSALAMLSKRVFFTILLLCFGAFFTASGEASDDIQYWSGYNFTKKIGPDSSVIYEPSLRLRDDASDFYYHEHLVGVQQQLFGPYRLGMHYLISRTQKSNDVWQTENRGELDLSGKWNWRAFRVSLRGRAELRYLNKDSKNELWRFRLKPQLAYPAKLGSMDVTPYVSDDIFYDADANAWNQNRFYVGAVLPIRKEENLTVNLDAYYMLENKKSAAGDWSANHIVGTKISFIF